MIRTFGNSGERLKYVTIKRKGCPRQILSKYSDPDDLFDALVELARLVDRKIIKKENNVSS